MGSEREIVVPEGMLKAVKKTYQEAYPEVELCSADIKILEKIAQTVLQHQAEHPPVPTREQVAKLLAPDFGIPPDDLSGNIIQGGQLMAIHWLRMAYAAPEPAPEIADLLWSLEQSDDEQSARAAQHNTELRTLYERMKAAQKAGSNE